jgi:hypothetical protein
MGVVATYYSWGTNPGDTKIADTPQTGCRLISARGSVIACESKLGVPNANVNILENIAIRPRSNLIAQYVTVSLN